MYKKLFVQATVKYLSGLLLLSALLFIPAGTLKYWNAWLFIAVLFIPMLITGIVLAVKNPELLRRRLNAKEKETEQKSVVFLSALMFIGGFVVAGLDYRFKWLLLPKGIVFAAAAVFLSAYLLYVEVLRENTYLSRTIEVQENQKVVDTGLYGIVRHPMYAATVLLFLSAPLVLGSLFSFAVFLIYPAITVKRIKNEEKVLEKELDGYSEYKTRIKYRLVPYIW
ncbi:MAG: isoprenylcysteine carboxylmethyltransferase family protein [Ruminococcaceae bacterium]|nr:isoprenylcysteine carboxylmethyltransferase family protein [Oscillospiraceae bacterium]